MRFGQRNGILIYSLIIVLSYTLIALGLMFGILPLLTVISFLTLPLAYRSVSAALTHHDNPQKFISAIRDAAAIYLSISSTLIFCSLFWEEKNDALAPLDLRLLDPACGSGTFLVLAIGRLRRYVEEHWVDKGTALRRITKNIVGFDLNPLAVIASRTNYLIALGDMLRERGDEPIEIPVYLADSILVERRQTLTGAAYILKTAVGEFSIPTSAVEKGLLAKTLTVIEECIRGKRSLNEFKARLLREVSLEKDEVLILSELFEKLLRLEKEGKNRIWTRILKNSFAPFFAGKFDYVVGVL
ncbi:MAG: hypothetical protein HA494_06015 [Thaumarchaeota archaeon]|nr:hypothetical protein [Nitrososphaerota archaeon]